VSLLRRKSLKPPRRLTGPNKARASGRVRRGQTDRFAGHPRRRPASASGEPPALRELLMMALALTAELQQQSAPRLYVDSLSLAYTGEGATDSTFVTDFSRLGFT
jgi:hypothetical protein